MADTKLTGLSAITSSSRQDLLYLVQNPTASPVSRVERVDDFFESSVADFPNNSSPAGSNLFLTIGNGQISAHKTTIDDAINSDFQEKSIETHTVLYSASFTSPSKFEITGISQNYDHLEIRTQLRSQTAAQQDGAYMFFNADTTVTNYRHFLIRNKNDSTQSTSADTPKIATIPDTATSGAAANSWAFSHMYIYGYANAMRKTVEGRYGARLSPVEHHDGTFALHWENTAAITRIDIVTDNDPTDLFSASSLVQVIGVKIGTVNA